MAEYLTLVEIHDAIAHALKQEDGAKETIIDYLINQVYLEEIMSVGDFQSRPFFWLITEVNTNRSKPPVDITGISQASSAVVSATSHGFVVGDVVSFDGVVGMTEINNQRATVATVPTADSFTVAIDTSGYTAYSSAGKVFHRGVTLPTDLERVYSAVWNGVSRPFIPVDYNQVNEGDTIYQYNTNTGCPDYYLHEFSMTAAGAYTHLLLWYPAADEARNLRVHYIKRATRLWEPTSVPLIPARFHDLIVAGVLTRMVEMKDPRVSAENATIWPAIYTAGLETLRKYNNDWWENVAQKQQVEHFLA